MRTVPPPPAARTDHFDVTLPDGSMNRTAMNLRSWLMAVGLVGACLAISQAATSPTAVADAGKNGKSKAKTQPTFIQPLVVDNPFAAQPHAAQPQAAPQHDAESKSVASQPIAGFQVDSEAPQVYRLPGAAGVAATESEERIAAALPPAAATEPPAEAWPKETTISTEATATENETPKNDISQTTDKPQLVAANDDILPLPAELDSSSPEPTATVAAEPEHDSPASISSEPQSTELATPTSDSPIAAAPEPGFSPSPSYGAVAPQKNATAFSANSAEMVPYMPVTAGLSAQLLPSVQRAYALAQRGSLYAAQTEFVQVLRRIAQAKDADEGYDDHSRRWPPASAPSTKPTTSLPPACSSKPK